MRLAVSFVLMMLCGMPAAAQRWTANTPQDKAYVGGWVSFPSNAITVSCAARSPLMGPVIDSIWFESIIPPPWHFGISISETLIPAGAGQRNDLMLFVDQTGYRLPPVVHDEMVGGWQFQLPMADPVFEKIKTAARLVLQVGGQAAWELPVDNLANALDQLRGTCAAGWGGTNGAAGGRAPRDLLSIAEEFAASNCSDFFNSGPRGVQSANIDGDGIDDIVLDYNDITCDNSARRPAVCGASLCSIDVFLSGSFARTGRPENLLGGSASIVPLSNGNAAVATSGNLSMCQSTQPCSFLWYWNGTTFTELKQ